MAQVRASGNPSGDEGPENPLPGLLPGPQPWRGGQIELDRESHIRLHPSSGFTPV